MTENIVLVCIDNFQEYILTNIKQLIHLGHEHIWVLTNSILFDKFADYPSIHLVNIHELEEPRGFAAASKLNRTFRGGFWLLSSLRFFYLQAFMKKYDVENVIHLENDVLIYYHCREIMNKFDRKYMYIPFDSFQRNIASIVYIPNADIFGKILDQYDFHKNDMENFRIIRDKTGLIQGLPIFPTRTDTPEMGFVTQNYDRFGGFIFDAAAIGQKIGGVDPHIIAGSTVGFINETCVVKYVFDVIWSADRKPFLCLESNIPIFNLHIHCKDLEKFI